MDSISFTPESQVSVASNALIFMKRIFCKIYGHTLYRFCPYGTKNVKYIKKISFALESKAHIHDIIIHETQIAQSQIK